MLIFLLFMLKFILNLRFRYLILQNVLSLKSVKNKNAEDPCKRWYWLSGSSLIDTCFPE